MGLKMQQQERKKMWITQSSGRENPRLMLKKNDTLLNIVLVSLVIEKLACIFNIFPNKSSAV